MTRMSGNDECPSGNFGDSSQLTNWILDSGETCHITPEVSDFIPGSLEDTDKHIEVADGHHVTAKQKGQARIKMCDDHGDPFIATLHNVLWHHIYATDYFQSLHYLIQDILVYSRKGFALCTSEQMRIMR